MSDDTISRQGAIDVVRNYYDPEDNSTESIEDRLKRLPSAQPEKVCVAEIKVDGEELRRCVDRAVERLKEELQTDMWIPCSERLPEVNGRYLVTRGLNACGSLWNRIYIANYSDLMGLKSERIWWNGNVGKSDFERIDDVIAWMTLPEPYKEERE